MGLRTKFGIMRHFTKEQLAGITTSVDCDNVFDTVLIRMVRELIAFEIDSETTKEEGVKTVMYPRSWWDHWKYDHRSWRICRYLKSPRYESESFPTTSYVTRNYQVVPCSRDGQPYMPPPRSSN